MLYFPSGSQWRVIRRWTHHSPSGALHEVAIAAPKIVARWTGRLPKGYSVSYSSQRGELVRDGMSWGGQDGTIGTYSSYAEARKVAEEYIAKIRLEG
jgi:hypothetical protein